MADRQETGEHRYFIEGMHCAACEVIIEKKLIGLEGVRSVEASTHDSSVLMEYSGEAPSIDLLNRLFESDGYTFSLSPSVAESRGSRTAALAGIAAAAVVSIALVVVLQKAGLAKLVTVDSSSSLPAFLLLGLVAGFSSCAALVGGLVLSMSKQWGELHSPEDPLKKRMEPHLLFNAGRLLSFACLGAVLALVGGAIRLTPTLSAMLVVAVSILMIALALQMLGVRYFNRFQLAAPKSLTRFVADEKRFKGRYMPFALGAMTFILPCGFTITAEGFALLSGEPLQGALIMLFFALGTLPMLLVIAFSSVKFLEKPRTADIFLKVAGVLVLFFAIFNINNQLVVLDAPNLGDLFSPARVASSGAGSAEVELPPVVGGKQVIKMEASASGYSPDAFTVKAGVPVRWEIEDTGTSGCTNAVISKDLFEGEVSLTPGKTSVVEFTPEKPGRFRFSCWMGMVTGEITVVDSSDPSKPVESKPATKPGSGGC